MHNLITAKSQFAYEQFQALTPRKEHKINVKKAKRRAYGFHKFCGLMLMGAFVLGICLLAEHALVISKGYNINIIKKEIASLKTANERLELSMAQLKSLNRVENIAITKLGMIEPSDSTTEFMDIRQHAIPVPSQSKIEIKKMPGKAVNPLIKSINDFVKGWVSQLPVQINPKG